MELFFAEVAIKVISPIFFYSGRGSWVEKKRGDVGDAAAVMEINLIFSSPLDCLQKVPQ